MWFKREQKNRRLSKARVLDVKLRSGQVRAARLRMAMVSLVLLGGTALGLAILWRAGEAAMNLLVYQNADFAIERIEVETDGVIAPDQLRRWSGVHPGANLIGLDLAAVKRNLELAPAIDSVSIERVLPHTLKIRVTERAPIAQVDIPHLDGAGGIAVTVFQLDADGMVTEPLDPRVCTAPLAQARDRLPVIAGLNVYQLQPGHRVDLPQARAALELIGEFGRSPMAGLEDLRRIDVSSPGVIVVTTGEGGEITFGLENPARQLRRWRAIYDLGRRSHQLIASADLAVGNNVPVSWMAPAAPAAPPANATSVNSRRKNV